MAESSILIIYTGGTIGSFIDHKTESYKPVEFDKLKEFLPELEMIDAHIDVHTISNPKDSSNMSPEDWIEMVEIIEGNYNKYDGFVVLHGTDTMTYSASALSFMIENLKKPVIFTGSQIPIGVIRTDGKENLITAIEIAAAKDENGDARVPEVCIYFEFKLYRANRTYKFSTSNFKAYLSPNYPLLAEAGVKIRYADNQIFDQPTGDTKFHKALETNIGLVKMYPGMNRQIAENVSRTNGIKAIIIETFGSGNATLQQWFFDWIEDCQSRGILVVNVSQCRQGNVQMGVYETSSKLRELRVLGGGDMILETAITKLMFLLANHHETEDVKALFSTSLRGEITT